MTTIRMMGATHPRLARNDRTTATFGSAIHAQLELAQLVEQSHAEIEGVPDQARRWLAQTFDPHGSITDAGERERLIEHRSRELRILAARRAKAGLEAVRAKVERAKADAQAASNRFANTITAGLAGLSAASIAGAQLLATAVLTGSPEVQAAFRQRVRRGEPDAVAAGAIMPQIGDLADIAQDARTAFGQQQLVAARGEGARHEVRDVELATDMVARQFDEVAAAVEEFGAADGKPEDLRRVSAMGLIGHGNAAARYRTAVAAGICDVPPPRVNVPPTPEQAREREHLSAPELMALAGQGGAA